MKAIILCAGYATRLYPLTKNFPKALLPIEENKPIINYILEQFESIEAISDVYIVTNSKFYSFFTEWEKNFRQNFKKSIMIINNGTKEEEDRLGAIGDINFVINDKNIKQDTVIIAGDNFFDFYLKDVYNFFENNKKDTVCTMKVLEKEKLKSMGVAEINENGKITSLIEKPENPQTNDAVFAIYFYKKETINLFSKYLEEGNPRDAPGHFLSWLYKRKDVLAYSIKGNCYDIGTIKSYEQVRKIYG